MRRIDRRYRRLEALGRSRGSSPRRFGVGPEFVVEALHKLHPASGQVASRRYCPARIPGRSDGARLTVGVAQMLVSGKNHKRREHRDTRLVREVTTAARS